MKFLAENLTNLEPIIEVLENLSLEVLPVKKLKKWTLSSLPTDTNPNNEHVKVPLAKASTSTGLKTPTPS